MNSQLYTIVFDANGGTGTMPSQNFVYGTPQKLKTNTFTKEKYIFWQWNTKADGSGESYEDEEVVSNLTNVNGETITLYATYAIEKYINNGDIVFDGTDKFDGKSYIDTGISLFSENNINKNFEVSFEITEREGTQEDKATMMTCLNEKNSPYQGIVYRVHDKSTNLDHFEGNATSSVKFSKEYTNSDIQKVTVKRINGILYLKFNDGQDNLIIDISQINVPINDTVIFGASLDKNVNKWRQFKGTLSNLKVVLYDSDITTGTIAFDANGGTGSPFTQEIGVGKTVKLKKNTYTKDGYTFAGWNTKADGSGTRYADQENVSNIVEGGKTINLYAQWQRNKYIVAFNANGGTGTMESQEFEYTVAKNLKKSTYTKVGYSFAFWNTKADGTGTSYEDEEVVENLSNKNGQTITLYAFYEKFSYQYAEEYSFNGTSDFINTEIYLFSKKNINKNFEISFEIKDNTFQKAQDTIISSMNEKRTPYEGFVFRYSNNTYYDIIANAVKQDELKKQFRIDSTTKVVISRKNSILTIKVNDGEELELMNYSNIKGPFYFPLSIGASLNGNLIPQRYFKGTLSNIKAELYE